MFKPSRARLMSVFSLCTAGLLPAMAPGAAGAAPADDARVVAALDTEFQSAVKRNDAATIGRILADDMILVTGRGAVFTKAGRDQIRIAPSLWPDISAALSARGRAGSSSVTERKAAPALLVRFQAAPSSTVPAAPSSTMR